MRRVECLTGWGNGPTWFEVEGDVGIADADGMEEVEIDIVIIRLHAATSSGVAECEAPPARIGMSVEWLEPTCALSLEQARALRDALDAAIDGRD